MSLRELLADLLGAEVQTRPVQWSGKKGTFHFRQISAEEGEAVFAETEGLTDRQRGRVVGCRLIAASLCTADGETVSTEAEVRKLPSGAINALYTAAADVNGMAKPESVEGDDGPKE